MSKRFFKVKQDNFLWHAGAILEPSKDANGYVAINGTTLWNVVEHNEYISKTVVENSPDWFEEVWEVKLLSKIVYCVKHKAREMMGDQFNVY